ncbi:MAG TPA: NAD(P)H-dependent oxidoreductase [Steroidobacteraceae bacterium]|jgi:FMN-dependent NADH-azoreductase|nr:NAD(P)H-dependent oxidoreductase [Steroidobacteraceae bacterium]
MSTLLQINASIQGESGQSSQLANRFVAAWRTQHPEGRVVRRDLAADPVPHLTAERFGAFLTAPEQRSDAQHAIANYSDTLIEELRRADVIVLGLPMYNFGIPSQLKAYFDHIARAGHTFRYTAQGPVGLLGGKKVYAFAARGGLYAGAPLDTQTPYVRDFLGFLGIRDVEFVFAEGLAIDAQRRDSALNAARARIDGLLEKRAAA